MTDLSTVQQVAVKEHPLVVIHRFLESRIAELKKILPPHISPDRFNRVVMTAIQKDPNLAACDQRSLWNACLMCASDGLLPDGREEAAFVAYKNKVQYLPMYGGLLKKFRNSGEFKSINAYIVYHDEQFEHWIDENGEHFKHVPGDERDLKKAKRVYASATTLNGGSFIADLSLSEINKRRAMSRATRDDSPWEKWPEEMMKKTAIRALSKYLPKSSDIDALLQRDEAALTSAEAVEERRHAVAAGSTMSALQRFAEEDEPPQEVDVEPAEKAGTPIDYKVIGAAAHSQGIPKNRPPGELRTADRADDLQRWEAGWDSAK